MSRLQNPSRRAVFRHAVIGLGVLGAALISAKNSIFAQAPPAGQPVRKQTKQEAAYQDHPNGSQSCAGCANFIAPNDCRVVEGPVAPNGWCRNFKPKT